MRSFLKIFLTMLVLACAFAGYLVYQPKATKQSGVARAPEVQPLHSTHGDAIIGGDGEVTAESLPGAGQTDSPLDPKNANAVTSGGGPTQPPSSGKLNHVV